VPGKGEYNGRIISFDTEKEDEHGYWINCLMLCNVPVQDQASIWERG
jgi:hypothetical protein